MRTYVIRRRGGGLFSIITSVLANLSVAESKGLEPYVDLESLPTPYQENMPVNGTRNVWEYYFSPVSRVSRAEALLSSEAESAEGFPEGFSDSLYQNEIYWKMWEKYCHLSQPSRQFVQSEMVRLNPSSNTLGVHFRGQEQRTASRHPLPPTLRQMADAVSHLLEFGGFEKILLATEGQQYVDYFLRRFPGRVDVTSTFRLRYKNSYRLRNPPRSQHLYRLGLESLSDAFLLASCGGLIGCNSNLTDGAAFLGRSRHSVSLVVNNGFNTAHPIFKKFKWYLHAGLPHSWGGFDNWKEATEVRVGRELIH